MFFNEQNYYLEWVGKAEMCQVHEFIHIIIVGNLANK